MEPKFAVDQAVSFDLGGKTVTGRVQGRTTGYISDIYNIYIVKLDFPINGQKAILVSADFMKPLACYWCGDSKKIYVTPFTGEQYATKTIPERDCPYHCPTCDEA